jgi:hypothetical protein
MQETVCARLKGSIIDGKCSISIKDIHFTEATREQLNDVAKDIFTTKSPDNRIIKIKSTPVGWIDAQKAMTVKGTEAFLYEMELTPEFQRKGLGEVIIKDYLSRKPAATRAYLHLPQPEHRSLWERVGTFVEETKNGWEIDVYPVDEIKLDEQFSTLLLKKM